VNASPQAFADAVTDLSRLDRGILRRLIRRVGLGTFRDTVLQPPGEAAKLVHVVSE
jgi:hypothetical protein